MEKGIITPTTKERMEELEAEKERAFNQDYERGNVAAKIVP